ncbi:MAG: hypothetical protein Q9160_000890 [Pyrenula sp. 1 TL-2023]
MAKRGTMRLNSDTDTDYAKAFQTIFKTQKSDRNAFDKVNGIFGKPETPATPNGSGNARYGIAGMIPEPNGDRAQANVRIYCDDDPQDLNGNSRWTLRPDISNPPPGYTPQAQRPRFSDAQPNEEYLEVWEDLLNGMLMGRTGGCKDPNTAAETYILERPGSTGQAHPRATMTVCLSLLLVLRALPADQLYLMDTNINFIVAQICDYQLNRQIHHMGMIPKKKDVSQIINPDDVNEDAGIGAFAVMTSVVVMHELTHLPGFDIEDQVSPSHPPDRAYGWDDSIDLHSADLSLNNADNYAFFALLAVLMDRHFRLSKIESETQFGKLVYDRNGITSRLMVRELGKGVEKVAQGLWKRWWTG